MVLDYDLDKLNTVLNNFHLVTGINISLYDENFNIVHTNGYLPPDYCRVIQSQYSNERPCKVSDLNLLKRCLEEKKLVMHICHAGLLDIAVPILYEESILGYLIFGQIRTDMEFSEIKEKIFHLHLNMEKMEEYYEKLRYIDHEKIYAIASIAEILTRHVMQENMMKPLLYSEIEPAVAFIHTNLCRNISIREICAHTHLSTSALYRQFRKHFGCTVSSYINSRRIEKAVEFLERTQFTIDSISEQLGFSDATYFTRIFKQEMGIPPTQYRKQIREKTER